MDPLVDLLLTIANLLPPQVQHLVAGIVPLWVAFCFAMDRVNAWVRKRAESGAPSLPLWVLRVLAVLNVPAINGDKAKQFWAGYRGPSVAAVVVKK